MNGNEKETITSILQRYASHDIDHLEKQVLPWWYKHALDREYGGVLTCLDNDGNRVSDHKYIWSQGRWAWLMGRIANLDKQDSILLGSNSPAHSMATETARFLFEHTVLEDGSTVYETTREGRPVPQQVPPGALHTSVFTDFFVVMGLSGAANSTHIERDRQSWLATAKRVFFSAVTRIREDRAFTEPYPTAADMRSVSSEMDILNTGSELYKATHDSDVAAETRRSASAVGDRLCASGKLPPDFELRQLTSESDALLITRHRTPGHILEMLWFLVDAYRSVLPATSLPLEKMVATAEQALKLGWDDEYGGIFRYVDYDGGKPRGKSRGDRYENLVLHTWSTKLWWPHVEALYATALLYSLTGSDPMLRWHRKVRDYTFAAFPKKDHEWLQIRDRSGRPLNEVVALPVKDPFHITRALLQMYELTEHKNVT